MIHVRNYIIRAIHVQIILAYVYTPIIISWGLPLSYMSVVSNLVFLPLMIAFLAVSCTLFITELLYLPNSYLCVVLDAVSSLWHTTLQYGSHNWLIGFPDPGIHVCAIIPAIGLSIYWLLKRYPIHIQCGLLGTVLIILLTTTKIYFSKQHISVSFKNQAALTYDAQKKWLIIPKIRTTQHALQSWFLYQARTTLYKQCGTCEVKTVILLNPTPTCISLIKQLRHLINYHNLIYTKTSTRKKISYIHFS
jgi:hypothetical protein